MTNLPPRHIEDTAPSFGAAMKHAPITQDEISARAASYAIRCLMAVALVIVIACSLPGQS